MEEQTLKALKEAFVTGLEGGSMTEINKVTAVALSAYALWAALQTRTRAPDCRVYPVPGFLLDVALNSICLLFSITTYSSQPILLNILLLTPAVVLYFQDPLPSKPEKIVKEAQKRQGQHEVQTSEKQSNHKPFVTAYRGGMMVITCLAILAVDFKVFPRRFAKAEMYGTSLMDMGVGSFVFSSGLVSSRQPATSAFKQIWTAFRSSATILALGIVRTVLTKYLNYQEHVTEYGVHWNFFITLGLLPIFVTLLRLLSRNKVPFSLVAVLISLGYEWSLFHVPVRDYDSIAAFIIFGSRSDLFSQNREGLFSFLGYLSIFLVGLDVGRVVLSAKPPSIPYIRSPQWRTFVSLLLFSIVSTIALQLTTEYFNHQVARRFANTAYVLWVISYNTTYLLGYLIVQMIFFSPNTPHVDAVPWTLEAVNTNGLAVFLLANILTGLVNMSYNTLQASNLEAMGVLSVYILGLNAFAAILRYEGRKIKI